MNIYTYNIVKICWLNKLQLDVTRIMLEVTDVLKRLLKSKDFNLFNFLLSFVKIKKRPTLFYYIVIIINIVVIVKIVAVAAIIMIMVLFFICTYFLK